MSNQILHTLMHALAHQSRHEQQHGRSGRANGIALIVFGILALPIPIIGVPMIGFGILKCIKG